MANENLEQLLTAARRLRPLLPELVFVGGSVTGLLVTDEGAAEPRATLDVDAIASIKSYAGYARFGERLRAQGFAEDTSEGAPLCRWVQGETVLDLMPLDEKILGFANRWYKAAMESAVTRRLADDIEIRVVTAPFFVATKLEAFKGRGKNDPLGSRDLDDLVALVDGRETLVSEIRAESAELRIYVRSEIRRLLANANFIDALPGFLLPDPVSQARIEVVIERLHGLARAEVKRRNTAKG